MNLVGNTSLSLVIQQANDTVVSFKPSVQQTHPLHNLSVDNLDGIFQFIPQNETALLDYVEKAKIEAQESLDAISKIPSALRNFDNTFYALDAAKTLIYHRRRAVEAISKTHPVASFRDKALAGKQQLIDDSSTLFDTKDVYNMCSAAYENIKKQNIPLSKEQEEYLESIMQSMRAEGLHLEKDKYLEIKTLIKEINELEASFLRNIDEDTSFITVPKEDIEGVPEGILKPLEENPSLIKITCKNTHYFPVMCYCKVEKTRKALYRAYENRAEDKNVPLLKTLIQKRQRYAELTGHISFAHLDISNQLAQTPEAVVTFLKGLKEGIRGKYNSEINSLKNDLPEGFTLDEQGCIKPWDLMYLQEAYKKKYFSVDENEIQQYFPFDRTLNKILKMFEEMFSVEIEIVKNNSLWEQPGHILVVKDKLSKDRIAGHIIIDPHPRDGKYPWGYCFDVLSPCRLPNGEVNPAIALLLVNFTSPNDKRESILTHRELLTLFHELGHAFHHLLGKAEMPSRSGYHTTTDALEWPSRLCENLMWEKDILKKLGEHYKNKEGEELAPIPDHLIEAKLKSRTATSGENFSRFFAQSMFSLRCYLNGVEDPKLLREEIEKDFLAGIACDPQIHKEAAFLHLAEHFYRSKYYAYFWADVFAFDTYEHIKKMQEQGVGDMWLQFRKVMLDHGGALNPNDLAKEFLGRYPKPDAYIRIIAGEKPEPAETDIKLSGAKQLIKA